MAIDPSIPLSYRPPAIAPPEIQTPLDRYTKMISLKNLMTEQQAGELGLQAKQFAFNEAQKGAQEETQFRQDIAANPNMSPAQVMAGLGSKAGPAYLKAMGDVTKLGYENEGQRVAALGSLAALPKDVPTAIAATNHAIEKRLFDTDPVKNAQVGQAMLDHINTAGFNADDWLRFQRGAMKAAEAIKAQQDAELQPSKVTKEKADAAKAVLESQAKQTEADATRLAAIFEQQGPEAFKAEVQKLGDRGLPFMTAKNPDQVLAGGTTAAEQIRAKQAAATLTQTTAQNAAQNRIAEENLAIRRKKDAREEAAYQQTYGANANQALVGVDPKLRVQVAGKADKAFQDHAKAVSAADDMQAFLDLAKSGNKEAYAYLSPEGVLTLNTGRGVTRVNRQEIEAYAGAGSWGDILKGKIGKALTGASISPDVIKDIEALHQRISQNADKNYQTTLDGLNQNYKSNYTFAGKRAGAPSTVKMKAPNGEIEDVPANQVEHFKQKGAVVVTGR